MASLSSFLRLRTSCPPNRGNLNECKTLTVKTVGDPKEAKALCHEGGKVHCESCEADRVAKRIGPPRKGHIVYIDQHGKECMMIIPLKKEE